MLVVQLQFRWVRISWNTPRFHTTPTELPSPLYNTPELPTSTEGKLKPTSCHRKAWKRARPTHDHTDSFRVPYRQGIITEDVLSHLGDCSRLACQRLCRTHHLVATVEVSRDNPLTAGFEMQIIKNSTCTHFSHAFGSSAFLTELPRRQLQGLPLAPHPTLGTLTVSVCTRTWGLRKITTGKSALQVTILQFSCLGVPP